MPYTLRHFLASPRGLRRGDLAVAEEEGPAVEEEDVGDGVGAEEEATAAGLGLRRMYLLPLVV